jgi:hypothetical protein
MCFGRLSSSVPAQLVTPVVFRKHIACNCSMSLRYCLEYMTKASIYHKTICNGLYNKRYMILFRSRLWYCRDLYWNLTIGILFIYKSRYISVDLLLFWFSDRIIYPFTQIKVYVSYGNVFIEYHHYMISE